MFYFLKKKKKEGAVSKRDTHRKHLGKIRV